MNLVQKSAGEKITASAMQDTDGSASHPYHFFEKVLPLRQCHRYRKAFAAMSAIIF